MDKLVDHFLGKSNLGIKAKTEAIQSGLFIIVHSHLTTYDYPKLSKKRRISWIIGIILLFIIIYYAWISLPIVTGYSAKLMCTCHYVSGRDKEGIDSSDLGEIPFNLASTTIHPGDSSVTASVLGLANQKTIYRLGLGCTLINNYSEEQIRSQKYNLPPTDAKPDSIAWYNRNQIFDRAPDSVVNLGKLQAALDRIFTEPYADKKQRTRAAIILHNDKIIAERYAPGFDTTSIFYGWSMAKSVTSALIGILVSKGRLDIDEPAPVPEWLKQLSL